jgi:hypothetical protein
LTKRSPTKHPSNVSAPVKHPPMFHYVHRDIWSQGWRYVHPPWTFFFEHFLGAKNVTGEHFEEPVISPAQPSDILSLVYISSWGILRPFFYKNSDTVP